MIAKDKAKELVAKYYQLAESIQWTDNETKVKAEKFNDELGSDVLKYWNELAKQSALIAVDEILNYMSEDHVFYRSSGIGVKKTYFEKVKQEIEKL